MDRELFRKLQAGREKYQKIRTKKRMRLERKLYNEGVVEVGELSERERFLVGVMLYWSEGFKHIDESRLGLATMDSNMAKFYIDWVEKCLRVKRMDLALRVTANIAYKDRIGVMEEYWAKKLNVSRKQFTMPFYQQSKQKRVHKDSSNYYGVIRIHVKRSLNMLRKMRGWMAGMARK